MDGVEVTTLFNLFPELPAAIQTAVKRAVRKAAFDIQADAMRGAAVDTGFLKNSIYVVTEGSSNYERAAIRAGKKSDAEMLPEVDPPPDKMTAYVAVGADYGVYVEFGTINMAAQPYLTPAAEWVRPQFIAALKEIEKLLPLGGALGGIGAEIDTI